MDGLIRSVEIAGYEGFYRVTTEGRVFSMKRSGRPLELELKPTIDYNGYRTVTLWRKALDGVARGKIYRIARLVALAFIPNPSNLPHVNHIDSNRDNDNVKNLEWVTPYENWLHSHNQGRLSKDHWCPVIQLTKQGILVREYPSMRSAARFNGMDVKHIASCIHGRYKTAGGYVWKKKA